MSGPWASCRFGPASLWFSLKKRVPRAQGLDLNLTATASVLWGSELWAQESSEGCLECDHVVGCGLEMEPPTCISEPLEF